jgi:hypothetical protein
MMKRFLASTVFLLILIAEASAASSLLDYEKRVARAAEQMERIRADEDYSEEGLSYVKKLLPASEQVSSNEKVIEVNNQWLHEKLDRLAAEADKNRRKELLNEIHGSLEALDVELINAQDISRETSGKEEAREKLKKILAEEQYREKKESPITKFINETRQKIKDFLVKLYLTIVQALFGSGGGSSLLFKLIFGAVVLLVGYLIVRMVMNYKPGKKRVKKRTVLGEEIEEDAKPGDLADAALAAARRGDFRLGVRKLYIALLYEMSERNLIELDSHATNREYLAKASAFSQLIPSMSYLTERFDYFWYGMFPSSQQDFIRFLETYREAVNRVQSISQQVAQTTTGK